jgi:hypothetical protein
MLWIRNLERVGESGAATISELEVASEAQIVGSMDYADKSIWFSPFTFMPGSDGLYKYLIRTPVSASERPTEMRPASRRGYVFPSGIHGEILDLLALYTSARFFRVAHYSHIPNSPLGRVKSEFRLPERKSSEDIDPVLFDEVSRSVEGFDGFLDSIRRIDETHHQAIILAAHHYHLALQEVGVDDEMVFIRLVSSIETVTRDVKLPASQDPLGRFELGDLLNEDLLDAGAKSDLLNLLNVRKSRARFCLFLENHCRGFFKPGGKKDDLTRIRRPELPGVAKAIYKARSSYLHSGESMFISQRIRDQTKWDRDPSVGRTMDNREYVAEDKLPFPYWFHRLVRHCLLDFIGGLDRQNNRRLADTLASEPVERR